MMSGGSGDHQRQRNLSKTVSLSRSVVLTQDTCIPSVLILGKLLRVSSDGASGSASGVDDMGLVRTRLLRDWAAASGTVNLWPVTADGAFLVQFQQEADLTRVMDGAPWCCDGGLLFLMRQAKPEVNLVDQLAGVGFTTADLWVQFHSVPVEYFNTASLCALATRIGVPVVLPDLGTAPVDLLRARIQVDITAPLVHSIPVDLDDGRSELVSVVYEGIPSLCRSCGIIAHPAGRCCPKVNLQTAAASSRSRGDKAAGYVRSRLGSGTSSSSREEHQPLLGKEKDDHPISTSTGCSSASATAGSGSAMLLPQPKPGEPSADADHLLVPETPGPQHHVSVNRCMPCNFRNLIFRKKRKELVREDKASHGGVNNLQHMPTTNHNHQTLLLTFSAPNVQESLTMMEQQETSPDRRALSTLTSFQLAGGYVSYYPYSGSRRNPRIEVKVETQCSSHLMNKSMKWLAENTGLKASFDGKRGVVSIVGLQVDQRMGPLDLVAYLYHEAGPKSGVSESPKKPDSPARFEDLMKSLLDENGCSKGASSSTRFSFG
ncbi:unnamed protein product [Miscanthus lutarioriparius]|uniref:DUF4283 domain-containing protein n=1 Tax=Miscanthus lutarioriparius TaxID=422564 RepID=A0A811NIK1_9POAL|nr:unnamed protein product [Miscanthus lutarioriparius]